VEGSTRLAASGGTGEVVEDAGLGESAVGDANGDGILDRRICFARDALRTLFDGREDRAPRTLRLEGMLTSGASYQALVSLRVEVPRAVDASVAPNPLNASGILTVRVARSAFATVSLHDVRGRRVRTLHRGYLTAGYHDFPLDGRDDRGRLLASGVYFCRVDTPEGTASRSLTFLK